MVWPFKRKLPDQEYIAMFRKFLATHQEVTANLTTSSQGEGIATLIAQEKEFHRVLPQRKLYRPLHRALDKTVRVQLMLAMYRMRAGDALDEFSRTGDAGKQSEFINLSKRADLCQHWAEESLAECLRRMEALPESDPIRLIAEAES